MEQPHLPTDDRRPPPPPRWVMLFALIALLLVIVFGIFHLASGHGPGLHQMHGGGAGTAPHARAVPVDAAFVGRWA